MTRPLVSICIPVFNGEIAIENCLNSILAQNVDSSEILVMDNQSQDRTTEIAEQMLASIPDSRVIRNEKNLGRIGNWNRCLEVSNGKYVKFIMVNDLLMKKSIQVLLNEAERSEDIVLVCSQAHFTDFIPSELPEMKTNPKIRNLPAVETLRLINEIGNPFWQLSGAIINLDILRYNNIQFNESLPYIADIDCFMRLSAKGHTVFIDTPSFLFNRSVKTRFHFSGLGPEIFYELKKYHNDCEQILLSYGETLVPQTSARIFDAYKWMLNAENKDIGFINTIRLFSDDKLLMIRALYEYLKYRTHTKK